MNLPNKTCSVTGCQFRIKDLLRASVVSCVHMFIWLFYHSYNAIMCGLKLIVLLNDYMFALFGFKHLPLWPTPRKSPSRQRGGTLWPLLVLPLVCPFPSLHGVLIGDTYQPTAGRFGCNTNRGSLKCSRWPQSMLKSYSPDSLKDWINKI